MDIESVRYYCLSLPLATEDSAFGDDCLLFRVCGKIFACIMFERAEWLTLKCDPDYAIDLRDTHPEITPAWHWNKRYWNQHSMSGRLSDDLVRSLIRHSYSEAVKNLTKTTRAAHPEITAIKA